MSGRIEVPIASDRYRILEDARALFYFLKAAEEGIGRRQFISWLRDQYNKIHTQAVYNGFFSPGNEYTSKQISDRNTLSVGRDFDPDTVKISLTQKMSDSQLVNIDFYSDSQDRNNAVKGLKRVEVYTTLVSSNGSNTMEDYPVHIAVKFNPQMITVRGKAFTESIKFSLRRTKI